MKKKSFILILTFCSINILIGQITIIPDENFEQALIDQNIDSDQILNGQVSTSDINTLISLNVSDGFISDLSGIEDFSSLENLRCSLNNLSELDVSDLIDLRQLYCDLNNISTLDLSNNMQLTRLSAQQNNLQNLDISQNLLLEYLLIGNFMDDFFPQNRISSLDLSNHINLISIYVRAIDLEELNLKNGANNLITYMDATFSNLLSCIQVDDEVAANNRQPPYDVWDVDDNRITFSEDCSLGVTEFEINLSVFPNPVKDRLFFKIDNGTLNSILVYDMLGKIHLNIKENDVRQIDLSLFNTGIYFVKFQIDNNNFIEKIVKK